MTAEELGTVRLLALPLDLHQRAQAHADELQRELRLVAEQLRRDGAADSSVPIRLVQLVAHLSGAYGGFTEEQELLIEAAIDRGDEVLDELVFRVPVHAADGARALAQMLDEADAFCREGEHLLTLATPPDLVRYRGWYLSQFCSQLGGGQPTPWPQYASGLTDAG